jgi:hypothetical protein
MIDQRVGIDLHRTVRGRIGSLFAGWTALIARTNRRLDSGTSGTCHEPSIAIFLMLSLGCSAVAADSKIYYWAHFPEPSRCKEKNEDDCSGVVVIRFYPSHVSSGARGTYYLIRLQKPADYEMECPENKDADTIACIKPLICRARNDQSSCEELNQTHPIRKFFKGNHISEPFALRKEFELREWRKADEDFQNMKYAMTDQSRLDANTREKRLLALQRFALEKSVNEVSTEYLKQTDQALQGIIKDLKDKGFEKASDKLAEDWKSFKERDGQPVFQFGWISDVVSRAVGSASLRLSHGGDQRDIDDLSRLTYYRLLVKRPDDQWSGPWTALAPQPRDGCLFNLAYDFGNTTSTRALRQIKDCLKEIAGQIRREDTQQQNVDEALLKLVDRLGHWQMPTDDKRAEQSEETFVGPLIQPSCGDVAVHHFGQDGGACWWSFGNNKPREDSGNVSAGSSNDANNSSNWKKRIASDNHDKKIYQDWFDEPVQSGESAWWLHLRQEWELKKRSGDRYLVDPQSCRFYIRRASDCVPWTFYLAIPPAVGLLILLFRGRVLLARDRSQ